MQPPEEDAYSSKFFDQLRSLFGRFRDEDLQHAFRMAVPIQCSELISNKGEWRTVAFFNEDRRLGEWCHNSFEEVKADLSVYTFKGTCSGDQGTIQVGTEFPIAASIDAYNQGRIGLDQVDINVNKPVNAVFEFDTRAYRFDLPYLFLVGKRSTGNIYSLIAPRRDDTYATDVSHRWECKAVKSSDVTYRFLICHTSTISRGLAGRNRDREPGFGASAYFILSDGMEAHTSVNISFGAPAGPADKAPVKPPPASPTEDPPATSTEKMPSLGGWQMPAVRFKFSDLEKSEFRLRFSPQTWIGKIGTSQVLADQKMMNPPSGKPPRDKEYCTWIPGSANLQNRLLASETDPAISYSFVAIDKNSQSPSLLLFDITTRSGGDIGTLQCLFPQAESVAAITFDRWVSIVGAHLTLEIRR